MKRRLLILALLFCVPAMVWGTQFNCASKGGGTGTGNFSSTTIWNLCNGHYPGYVDGNTYSAQIAAGDVVQWDVLTPITLTAAGTTPALRVAGSSSSSYGTLNGVAGGIVTLVGVSGGTGTALDVQHYGVFNTKGLSILADPVTTLDSTMAIGTINGIMNTGPSRNACTTHCYGLYDPAVTYVVDDIVKFAPYNQTTSFSPGVDHWFHYYQALGTTTGNAPPFGEPPNQRNAGTPTVSDTNWIRIDTMFSAPYAGCGSNCYTWGTYGNPGVDYLTSHAYTQNTVITPYQNNAGVYNFKNLASACTTTTAPASWNQTPGGTTTDPSGCVWTNQGNMSLYSCPGVCGSIDKNAFPNIYTVAAMSGSASGFRPVSNAAHTDLGHYGDTSFVFTTTLCGVTAVEEPTITSLVANGQYWFDYLNNLYVFYCTFGSPLPNYSYYYLALTGGSILKETANNADYEEMVFDKTSFEYVGGSGGYVTLPILTMGRNSTPGTSFVYTNNSMMFANAGGIALGNHTPDNNGVAGTSLSYIPINSNAFINVNSLEFSGQGGSITVRWGTNSYVSVQNNYLWGHGTGLINVDNYATPAYSGVGNQTSWKILHNFFGPGTFFGYGNQVAAAPYVTPWIGATEIADCIGLGFQFGDDLDRGWANFMGVTGDHVRLHDCASITYFRGFSITGWNDTYNTVTVSANHHGFFGPQMARTAPGAVFSEANVYNNLILTTEASSNNGCIQTGYVTVSYQDKTTIRNNTCYLIASGLGVFEIGDAADGTGYAYATNFSEYGNLSVSGGVGFVKTADAFTSASLYKVNRLHPNIYDWNDTYTLATSLYTVGGGINQIATFYNSSGAEYNTNQATNTIVNVAIWNPSSGYSPSNANLTGHSLAWNYTNPTTVTAAWDGGTPVSMVFCSGTATGGSTTTVVDANSAADCGNAWSQNPTNAGSIMGRWILMTSGLNSGQVRRIVDMKVANTAEVVPAFGSAVANTDTYVIYKSEVVLTDTGSNTVTIDPLWANPVTGGTVQTPTTACGTPPCTYTENNISMAFNILGAYNSTAGINPKFFDATCNVYKWNATQGGTADWPSTYSTLSRNAGPNVTAGSPIYVQSSLMPYLSQCFMAYNWQLSNADGHGRDVGKKTYPAAINSN